MKTSKMGSDLTKKISQEIYEQILNFYFVQTSLANSLHMYV